MSLPFPKTDLIPVPVGADPTKYVAAVDWNATSSAAFIGTTYGDGSDGNATLDGTTTVLGMVPVSSVYTATRDLLFQTLTLDNGVTLAMSNFRLFVRELDGPLTGMAFIASDGGPGNTSFVGSSGICPVGSMPGGAAGGEGVGNQAGQPGITGSSCPRMLAAGGTAGAGGAGGTGVGGAAGGTVAQDPTFGEVNTYPSAVLGTWPSKPGNTITGGGGGGSGGSDTGSGRGGGGGSGGGWLVVCARVWSGLITLRARGGRGGDGYALGTASGGGGGGKGGIVTWLSSLATIPTTDVSGGVGGAGENSGANGTNGTAGFVINLSGG